MLDKNTCTQLQLAAKCRPTTWFNVSTAPGRENDRPHKVYYDCIAVGSRWLADHYGRAKWQADLLAHCF